MVCKETGKFRQEKLLFLQFMQCSLYNNCFLHFSYSTSIHFKPMFQLRKNTFFVSGTLGWNGSNTFQKKLTLTKHGSVFSLKIDRSNWCICTILLNKSWVVVLKVPSLIADLTWALFTSHLHLSKIRSKFLN